MTKHNFVWIPVEAGKLILDGTGFAVTYDGSQDMPYRLRHPHGERHDRSYSLLVGAKMDAETQAAELIEMGLISLSEAE